MIKISLTVLLLLSFNALAFKDDPYEKFDATTNFTQQNIVIWKVVKNASKTCQEESRKRGFNGWSYSVDACSFWNDKHGYPLTCTIITSKKTDMHTVGHEIRHCFQGKFHE